MVCEISVPQTGLNQDHSSESTVSYLPDHQGTPPDLLLIAEGPVIVMKYYDYNSISQTLKIWKVGQSHVKRKHDLAR